MTTAALSVTPGVGAQVANYSISEDALTKLIQRISLNSSGGIEYPLSSGYYVPVAASQTAAVIQSSTGAIGDYLDHVVVIPAATNCGVVTILDNATPLIAWPGGVGTALLTLTPFTIFVGGLSRSGAWKITTGASVSVLALGRFS